MTVLGQGPPGPISDRTEGQQVLRPFKLHEPETVADAVSLLGQFGWEAGVYAGGTELLLAMKEGLLTYSHMVNIQTVPGLNEIGYNSDGRELRIGPAVTHRSLEQSPVVKAEFPLIAQAEAGVANVRVRNVGTIGGNLCFGEPHSDPATFLLLYDSHLTVQGSAGARSFSLSQLHQGPFETCLEEDEVLTGITVPKFPQGMSGAYLKFGLHQRPSVGLGVALRLDGGALVECRIAVGSAGPKPVRVHEAEEMMRGVTVGDLLGDDFGRRSTMLDQAGRLAAQEVQPDDDMHGSAEYKAHMVGVLLGKTFQSVLDTEG